MGKEGGRPHSVGAAGCSCWSCQVLPPLCIPQGSLAPWGRVLGSFHMSLECLVGAWDAAESKASHSIGAAGPLWVSPCFPCFSLSCGHLGGVIISPAGAHSHAGPAGTVVFSHKSWAFSQTCLGLELVNRERLGGPTAGPGRELVGRTPESFCLLLPPPGFLPPWVSSWAPWVSGQAAAPGRAGGHLPTICRVRASADPVTGDPGGHAARVWPASVPEHSKWWRRAPGWGVGALLCHVPRAHSGFSRR